MFLNVNGLSSPLPILAVVRFLLDKSLLLKLSTNIPLLNLSFPLESSTFKVFVLSSSKVKDVSLSKFSILSSRLPISLIVYLLLSIEDITTSSVSYR